jgi:Cytochrome P460
MKCGYSREILALYVEDDLPSQESIDKVELHFAGCADCRQYCEQLRKSQSFIKSRFEWSRQAPVNQAALTRVRQSVMSQIPAIQENSGWVVKFERFLTLGLRRHRYAVAGFAFAAIVSASLLGQIRHPAQRDGAAVFGAMNSLVRPAAYRQWVFVGSSLEHKTSLSGDGATNHKVYIDPAAYNEYTHSGQFPDGTVMVLEEDFGAIEVSVKDSARFEDGWGFYDFSDEAGKLKPQADPLPETAGCIGCHREKAATDHVFTQFYPNLRSNAGSNGV